MNPYVAAPFLVVVALIQSTLSPRLQIGAIWPDFMLLVVVSWALLGRLAEALVWSMAGGLVVDLMSGGPFGGTGLALMVATLAAAVMAEGVFRGRTVLPIAAALVASLAFHGAYLLALLLVGRPVDGLEALLRAAIPAAVYNAALSLAVYGLMAAIDRRIKPKPLRW